MRLLLWSQNVFPFEEAAAKEKFAERIKEYGTHFWLMCEEEKVIAFVDGMVTDEKNLTDEMYEKACLHDEKGAWQMIFGVNTLPKYRRQGYAESCFATQSMMQEHRTGKAWS